MYPQGELNTLHAAKASLQRRIAVRRHQLAADADLAMQPLRWLDRAHAQWRSLAPLVRLAAVPLGLWLTRAVAKRRRFAGRLLRWGSTLFGLVRAFI